MESPALGGDAFLNEVIDAVSGGDGEKREWAETVVENEEIVEIFVAKVRRALRAVREARGLSMETAADLVGVSTSTLSRLETGAIGKIDLKLVARVALMLGVAPRLDFAGRGSAATVSVGDAETIQANPEGLQRLDQPSMTIPVVSRAEGGGMAAGDDGNTRFHPNARLATVAGAGAAGVAPVVIPVTVPAAQDPRILDLRIRDLEARMASMERRRVVTND